MQQEEAIEVPATAPAILKPNEAVERVSRELNMNADSLWVMFDRAMKYPRDIEKVLATAMRELIIVPELAARSYYSIPYNLGKQNESRVEGPGIKAAMTLARNWGNCLNQGKIGGEDKSSILAIGVFMDFETGAHSYRELRVSKFYKPRGSQGVVPKNADMMYNSTQAGVSKAVRNVTLAMLPDWLVNSYYEKAKDLVINPPKKIGATVESIQNRLMKGKQAICKAFGVKPEEMEAYLADNADSIEDDASLLKHIIGLYTGLKEGHYTVDQVFRGGEAPTAAGMPQEKR
jgi:hypothetical protein